MLVPRIDQVFRRLCAIIVISWSVVPSFCQFPQVLTTPYISLWGVGTPEFHSIDHGLTSEYSITVARVEKTKKNSAVLRFGVLDRRTDEVVMNTVLYRIPDENWAYEQLLTINDACWLIFIQWDSNSKVRIMAQKLDTPSMQAVVAPIEVGQIAFDPKSFDDAKNGLGLAFVKSPDKNKVLMYFDGIKDKEDDQLIMCWVFDPNMRLVWGNTFHVSVEAEKVATLDLAITNAAEVYALMRSRFKNRPISGHAVNYSFEMFRMDGMNMLSQPIDLPNELKATTARMLMVPDGLICGGFFVEESRSAKVTAGWYTAIFDRGLINKAKVTVAKSPDELKDGINVTSFMRSKDGGYYLVGEKFNPILGRTHFVEGPVSAVAFDGYGVQKWAHIVNRSSESYYLDKFGFTAIPSDAGLELLFVDTPDNLERLQRGEKTRKNTIHSSTRIMREHISHDGEVTFVAETTGNDFKIGGQVVELDNGELCIMELLNSGRPLNMYTIRFE